MTNLPPEITVELVDSQPEIVIQIEQPPEIKVELAEVGLVGPAGPEGPQGPPGPSAELVLDEHIIDETPHPVYDEGPSLVLLYENAKV